MGMIPFNDLFQTTLWCCDVPDRFRYEFFFNCWTQIHDLMIKISIHHFLKHAQRWAPQLCHAHTPDGVHGVLWCPVAEWHHNNMWTDKTDPILQYHFVNESSKADVQLFHCGQHYQELPSKTGATQFGILWRKDDVISLYRTLTPTWLLTSIKLTMPRCTSHKQSPENVRKV